MRSLAKKSKNTKFQYSATSKQIRIDYTQDINNSSGGYLPDIVASLKFHNE